MNGDVNGFEGKIELIQMKQPRYNLTKQFHDSFDYLQKFVLAFYHVFFKMKYSMLK